MSHGAQFPGHLEGARDSGRAGCSLPGPSGGPGHGFLAPVLDLEGGWEEGLSSGSLVNEGFSPPPKPTLLLTGAIHGLLLGQKQ